MISDVIHMKTSWLHILNMEVIRYVDIYMTERIFLVFWFLSFSAIQLSFLHTFVFPIFVIFCIVDAGMWHSTPM